MREEDKSVYIWVYVFDGILKTHHAVVRDTTNNPVSKDYGWPLSLWRAHLWGVLHRHGWLPVKNEPNA